MISFVTTIAPMTKKQIKIIQNNCFDCFDSCPIKHEVIIVGESFGADKVCKDRNYKFVKDGTINIEGRPFLKFYKWLEAFKYAKGDIKIWINADVLFSYKELVLLIDKVKEMKNYFLLGQRYDVVVEERINFNIDNQHEVIQALIKRGVKHAPTGKDYFIFDFDITKYDIDKTLIIPFPGCDCYLTSYMGNKKEISVYDIGDIFKVISQEHRRDYKSKIGIAGWQEQSKYVLKMVKKFNSSNLTSSYPKLI